MAPDQSCTRPGTITWPTTRSYCFPNPVIQPNAGGFNLVPYSVPTVPYVSHFKCRGYEYLPQWMLLFLHDLKADRNVKHISQSFRYAGLQSAIPMIQSSWFLSSPSPAQTINKWPAFYRLFGLMGPTTIHQLSFQLAQNFSCWEKCGGSAVPYIFYQTMYACTRTHVSMVRRSELVGILFPTSTWGNRAGFQES